MVPFPTRFGWGLNRDTEGVGFGTFARPALSCSTSFLSVLFDHHGQITLVSMQIAELTVDNKLERVGGLGRMCHPSLSSY